MKTKSKSKSKSLLSANFADQFENLASNYEGENFTAKEINSLKAQAGSLVSMALSAGFFKEDKSTLESEYQHGRNTSEDKGCLLLWQKLVEMCVGYSVTFHY